MHDQTKSGLRFHYQQSIYALTHIHVSNHVKYTLNNKCTIFYVHIYRQYPQPKPADVHPIMDSSARSQCVSPVSGAPLTTAVPHSGSSVDASSMVASKPHQLTSPDTTREHDAVLEKLRRRRLELKQQRENVSKTSAVNETKTEVSSQKCIQPARTTSYSGGMASQQSAEDLTYVSSGVICANCKNKVPLGIKHCNCCGQPMHPMAKHEIERDNTDGRSTTMSPCGTMKTMESEKASSASSSFGLQNMLNLNQFQKDRQHKVILDYIHLQNCPVV